MDYGKWRYQQQKKEDKSRASSRGGQLKELKLKTVRIGDHDLTIKINHAREFLKEGNKVQFTLQFKGREMAHLELGRDIMKKIKEDLWPVSKVERDAKMEGRRMTLVLQPDHKAPGTKPPVPGAPKLVTPRPVGAPGAPAAGGPAPATQLRSQGASGAGEGLNIPVPPAARPAPVAPMPTAPAPARTQAPAPAGAR
jgi:translation initiation factor IF-3